MNNQTLIRGRLQHKYHLCERCGVRYPLTELSYQSGILVDHANCHDTMTPTERDGVMARKVAIAGQSRELEPDFKILEGTNTDTDDLQFMS